MRSRDRATGGGSLLSHAVESGRPEVYTWGRTAMSVLKSPEGGAVGERRWEEDEKG